MAGLTITTAGTYDGAGATVDWILIEGASGTVIVKNYIVTGATSTYLGDSISIAQCVIDLTLEHISSAGTQALRVWPYLASPMTLGTLETKHCYFNGKTHIYPDNDNATINITNSLFIGSTAEIIWVTRTYRVNLTNVTVISAAHIYEALYFEYGPNSPSATITNCNFYDYSDSHYAIYLASGGPTLTGSNNNYYGFLNYINSGATATNLDPVFDAHTDAGIYPGDYYLGASSPCINAGSGNVSEYDWIADYAHSAYATADTGIIDIGFHYPPGGEVTGSVQCIFGRLVNFAGARVKRLSPTVT